MSKVRISKAAKMVGKSKHTIYRDIENGLVSCESDGRGFKVIEVSELERFYGKLEQQASPSTTAEETSQQSQFDKPIQHETLKMGEVPADKLIEVLEDQVAILTRQLENATDQIRDATTEKTQLLELLSAEQEKTKLLMLPAPKQKAFGWFARLITFCRRKQLSHD